MPKEEEVYNQFLVSEFEKIAKEQYFKTSDSAEIKVLTTKASKANANGYTMLLVSGWGTVIPGWEHVLMEAVKDFDIVYIESREKGSFRPAQHKTVNDVERLALDVKEVLESLKIDQQQLVTVTSSFSTLTMANLLGTKKISPKLNILIGPVHQLNMPPTTRYLMHIIPNFVINWTKPIWRWWVRKFKSEDPIQAAKYYRVLDEADFAKWRAVAKRVCFTKVWDEYRQIEGTRVVIIGMEKDKMHKAELAKNIQAAIPDAEYVDMETNRATHSAEMVETIRKLLSIK